MPKSPKISPEERRWRAQDDLRTLKSAHEIQSDKERLRNAHNEAREQMKALSTISRGGQKAGRNSKAARTKRLEKMKI